MFFEKEILLSLPWIPLLLIFLLFVFLLLLLFKANGTVSNAISIFAMFGSAPIFLFEFLSFIYLGKLEYLIYSIVSFLFLLYFVELFYRKKTKDEQE